MPKRAFAFLFCVVATGLYLTGCGPPDLVAHPPPEGDALDHYHQAVVAIESQPELED
ncbi:MAG: hypothetical protein ACR2NZ_14620 [Rubripirellula sp.]